MRILPFLLFLFWPLFVQCAEPPPSSAPLFAATLADLHDRPVALEAYRGRPLVVNFWGRWCGPCRDEIPGLIAERARQKAGVEVLGIAVEDQAGAVRDFAKAHGIDYPVLLAGNQGIALMQALGNKVAGVPYTLVIDRRGKVLLTRLGPMKPSEIAAAFAAAAK